MAEYIQGGSGQIPGLGGGTEASWVQLTAAGIVGDEDPNVIKDGAVTESGGFLQIPVDSDALYATLNATYNIRWALPAALVLDGSKPQLLLVEVEFDTLPTGQWTAALGIRDPASTPIGLAAGIRRLVGGNTAPFVNRAAGSATGGAVSATALLAFGCIGAIGAWDDVEIVDNVASSTVSQAGGPAESIPTTNAGAVGLRSRSHLVLSIGSFAAAAETLAIKGRYAVLDLTG